MVGEAGRSEGMNAGSVLFLLLVAAVVVIVCQGAKIVAQERIIKELDKRARGPRVMPRSVGADVIGRGQRIGRGK